VPFRESRTLPRILSCLVLSAAAAWPARAQGPVPAANLLPNPSFEENSVDGVSGWRSRAWHGKENAR